MSEQIKFNILPEKDNMIYEERESGITHSAFSLEYDLYTGIRNGDRIQVKNAIRKYMKSGFVVGRLSRDSLRQIKYWAVACISVGIHYAILGGLDETDAFNKSDEYIRYVDQCKSIEECIHYLELKAVELTGLVQNVAFRGVRSDSVRECIHYIHVHLHDRLEISSLAETLGLSRDYLSALFKKETGIALHTYIMKEKLTVAKEMIKKGATNEQVSYSLGFCSETHFIKNFKREYGLTPGVFKKEL